MMWRIAAVMHLVVPEMLLLLLPFLTNTADANTADTYECMDTVFGGGTTCSSNDVKFERVVSFQVTDPLALAEPPCTCNCGGDTGVTCTGWSETEAAVDCDSVTTPISCWAPHDGPLMPTGVVFGACLGNDDKVTIALTVDLIVGNTRYDVAMYINLDGGSARTGTECAILPMVDGTYGTVIVASTGGDADGDGCPDITTLVTLTNFELAPITLQCTDHESDGLLDFDIAISWNKFSNDNCYFDGNVANLPQPDVVSKCSNARINVPIYVPPLTTPTLQPSLSSAPSIQPSTSREPSFNPSLSTEPSSQPTFLSAAPSEEPSNVSSDVPSLAPSSQPSSQPSNVSSKSAKAKAGKRTKMAHATAETNFQTQEMKSPGSSFVCMSPLVGLLLNSLSLIVAFATM